MKLIEEIVPAIASQPANPFAARGLASLEGLTFGDVLILPGKTSVKPEQVALHSEVALGLSAGLPVLQPP